MPPVPPPRPNPPAGQATRAGLDDVTSKLDEAADRLAEAATAYKPVVEANQAAFDRLMDAQAKWAEVMARQKPPPGPAPAPAPTQTQLDRFQEMANQTGQPYRLGTRLVLPELAPAPVPSPPPAPPTRVIPPQSTQVNPPPAPPPLSSPPPPPPPPLPPWPSMYGQARAELRKPDVQAEIRERALAGVFEHAQDVDIAGRRTLIENQALDSPEHRALAAAQARLGTIQQTGGTVQAAQAAQARARYAESPEGQEQFHLQDEARRHLQEAQERQRRAENIAEYGRLGAALLETRNRLGGFGGALRMGAIALAGTGIVAHTAMRWGGQASPQAAATLQGSWQLFQTYVGAEFLPEMRSTSRTLQRAGRSFAELRQTNPRLASALAWGGAGATAGAGIGFMVGGPVGAAVGTVVGGAAGATYGAARVSTITGQGQLANIRPEFAANQAALQERLFGPEMMARARRAQRTPQDIAESWAGMPVGTTLGGGEEVMYHVQQAALSMDPLQTEQFQEQLRNLSGLLQQVVTNTDPRNNPAPAWR